MSVLFKRKVTEKNDKMVFFLFSDASWAFVLKKQKATKQTPLMRLSSKNAGSSHSHRAPHLHSH